MKELDVLLERFLENVYPQCDPATRRAFERLLDYPDTELHAWLALGARPSDPDVHLVVERITRTAPRAAS